MTYMGSPQPQRTITKNTPVSLNLAVAIVVLAVTGLTAIGGLLWAGSGWATTIETRLLALEKQFQFAVDSRWRRTDEAMAWKTFGQLNPELQLPPIVED